MGLYKVCKPESGPVRATFKNLIFLENYINHITGVYGSQGPLQNRLNWDLKFYASFVILGRTGSGLTSLERAQRAEKYAIYRIKIGPLFMELFKVEVI